MNRAYTRTLARTFNRERALAIVAAALAGKANGPRKISRMVPGAAGKPLPPSSIDHYLKKAVRDKVLIHDNGGYIAGPYYESWRAALSNGVAQPMAGPSNTLLCTGVEFRFHVQEATGKPLEVSYMASNTRVFRAQVDLRDGIRGKFAIWNGKTVVLWVDPFVWDRPAPEAYDYVMQLAFDGLQKISYALKAHGIILGPPVPYPDRDAKASVAPLPTGSLSHIVPGGPMPRVRIGPAVVMDASKGYNAIESPDTHYWHVLANLPLEVDRLHDAIKDMNAKVDRPPVPDPRLDLLGRGVAGIYTLLAQAREDAKTQREHFQHLEESLDRIGEFIAYSLASQVEAAPSRPDSPRRMT